MPLRDLPIVLVGLRGVGKTTVGRLLARELALEFIDLDEEIARRAMSRGEAEVGSSAGDLLERCGLAEFRALETAALEALLDPPRPIVVAAGGGVVEADSNRGLLRRRALCLWLRDTPEVLASRVDADPRKRPALVPGGSLAEARELERIRAPLYSEVARIELDCGARSPEKIAAAMLQGLSLLRASP
ncbi:MAG: shikimate kinase [Planctomycetota bacterium]